jgi:hypothetical protein
LEAFLCAFGDEQQLELERLNNVIDLLVRSHNALSESIWVTSALAITALEALMHFHVGNWLY